MKKKQKKKSRWESIKDFYHLYTSGLNRYEIERLLKRESFDVFSYYKRGVNSAKESEKKKQFPFNQLDAFKEIFISFVLKLTPARRLFYGVAVLLFLFAMLSRNWNYGLIAFLLINLLLAFELADKMVAKDDLEIARDIQIGLQPENDPEIDGVDVAAFSQPAKEVGGDYYDLIKLDEHRFAVIVADVSGKGLPAALYAVKLQGLVELAVKNFDSPKKMLVGINEIITQRLRKQYFITAVLAVFDLKAKKLFLARAGHAPPLFFKAEKKKAVWLNPKGVGIGLSNNSNFSKEMSEKVVDISDEDLFLFYTDGITEAMNRSKKQFGENRLAKLISENAHLSAKELIDTLTGSLNYFVQKAFLDDDATMVAVKLQKAG